MAEEQQSRQWVRTDTYGGKLVENLTQAAARDLCAIAMVACEANGLPVVLSCHDELVCEVPAAEGEAALARLVQLMTTAPTWAEGIPIKAEGWVGRRYRKG
jgi:DNA polymerase